MKRSILLSSVAAWCCLGLVGPGFAAPPPAAPVVVAPATTAEAFLTLMTASKQTGQNEAVAAKDHAKQELQRQVTALLQEHIDAPAWTALLERARAAAAITEDRGVRRSCDSEASRVAAPVVRFGASGVAVMR